MRKLVVFATMIAMASHASLAAGPSLTDLVPIKLQPGVNQIAQLAPDGRRGMIVLGWRENGNAHGYDTALVMLQDHNDGWNVVRRERQPLVADDRGDDMITDTPHTFDDMVRAFRFARGRVDGTPATLLFVATRDRAETIPEASRVTFDVYRLHHDMEIGAIPDQFVAIHQDRSNQEFCNAEMALFRRFGLPLRPSYAGGHTQDGC